MGNRRQLRVLALDVPAERAVGTLRLFGAFVVGGAALWLLGLGPGWIGGVFVFLGLAFSIGWVAAYARMRNRTRDPYAFRLELSETGIRRIDPKAEVFVPWAAVQAIEVDEGSLKIQIVQDNGPVVWVEPIYAEMGAYALSETLSDAWREALQ